MRIVSLCPSNTEILSALGLLGQVVGVDDRSDWPPAVRLPPRVGPDLQIDMARVAELKPDLVVASLSVPGMDRNIAELRDRSLNHVVLDPHSLSDVWESIRTVANATGTTDRAETVLGELAVRVERVSAAAALRRRRARVYWEWWPKPLIAPGGLNWLTEITNLAGGVSATGDVDADTARPAPGEIVSFDPELILLAWPGIATDKVKPELVRTRPGWETVTAVQHSQIFVTEPGIFCHPSQRLVDGLEHLQGLLDNLLDSNIR